MKYLITLFLFATILQAEPYGTYTNGSEGFYRESLILSKDGKGFYAMMAGVPVLWSYNTITKKITIKGNLGVNLKVEERVFGYDETKDYIITSRKASPGDELLGCADKNVDPRIQKALDTFDWNLEKHQIQK
jgi:hypothetical protein